MRCCPIPPRQAKAHFPSLIGSDTQIAAIQAAISLGDRFIAEGPEIPPVRIKFDKNAECYKGVVQLPDRTKPLRHLIAVSEAFASNSGANVGRILLADSSPQFLWTSLVQLHGLPAVPEWGEWFVGQLEIHRALVPLLGLGCNPVLVKGSKEQFLAWLAWGVKSGQLPFPDRTGPTSWPRLTLDAIFHREEVKSATGRLLCC